jgi:uncharacterized membrane protein YfhO
MIYENRNAFPRTFFLNNLKFAKDKDQAIKMLFDPSINLAQTGIVENGDEKVNSNWSVGIAKITKYSENKIFINTENNGDGFLILTDTYYPTWRVSIDGRQAKIYITDYNFRGIIVPSGNHIVEFYNSIF